MQVMPGTYASLRVRYRLGPDPYAVRDNVMAGAAYLREMHDRYGSPAFLPAYNAGPGRLYQHLRTGRPVPAEARDRKSVGSGKRVAVRVELRGRRPLKKKKT